jgi:VIT1/CCC1 family predicted Fe2+/Mn2+ transporter
MMELKHRSELTAINIISAALGAFLVASPWLFGFSGERTATLSACITGVLIGLVALVSFIQLREWEGWTGLMLGVWALVAPWILGFDGLVAAMWSHVGVGVAVAAMAALELWMMHRDPPVRTA